MVETLETVDTALDAAAIWSDVVHVCRRIPPLWDLRNYVAVNPFLGFTSEPIGSAAQVVGDGLGARVLPGVDFYRTRWTEGAFGPAHLASAARKTGHSPEVLEAILTGQNAMPLRKARRVQTCAENHDVTFGTTWNDQVTRSVARWCSVHVSKGGTYWPVSNEGLDLYSSWCEVARVDRSLEIAGLSGWRAYMRDLPATADEAISQILSRLQLTPALRVAYLYRLLGGLYGWASFLRRESWQAGHEEPRAVADLLAIRLCADVAVMELARPSKRASVTVVPAEVEDESVLLVFQGALEDAFAQQVLSRVTSSDQGPIRSRPAVQAVFCIDVRSEPLRRHLEGQSAQIETLGFAGFFGVALDWQVQGEHSARCPVLLSPGVCLQPSASTTPGVGNPTIKHAQSAPAVSFSFVEVLGLAYGIGLASDALKLTPGQADVEGRADFHLDSNGHGTGIPLENRVDLAAGILKNMGLRSRFGRLVLLCGHEGQSANNPHAASLDCGACGGHGGAINARVAAAILNDPGVRAGLLARGWTIPADTHFVPGVHLTATDEVHLLDTQNVPASHQIDLEQLRAWLAQAGEGVRRERSIALGLGNQPVAWLDRLLRGRARDWSEVRPEWGLARNAAFLVARRERSRGVDLQGRVFLHEYDATTDPDNSILTLILSAPMVVASWINLQYFASTVDNDTFGCGTKALHNRVGSVGVVLGNGGDLRTGLAAQSVHTACGKWFHEPLRLQVIVEAAQQRIEQVLAVQPGVKDLVDNGWVRLFALERDQPRMARWVPERGWEIVEG